MKIPMLATSLLLAGLAVPAMAQMAPAPAVDPAAAPSDASPPAPMPPVSNPPAQQDPNAGQPNGAMPPMASTMQPADPSVQNNPAAPVGSAANPVVMGGNMTAPPTTPKDYPLCTRTIQDSCVNPGERHRSRG